MLDAGLGFVNAFVHGNEAVGAVLSINAVYAGAWARPNVREEEEEEMLRRLLRNRCRRCPGRQGPLFAAVEVRRRLPRKLQSSAESADPPAAGAERRPGIPMATLGRSPALSEAEAATCRGAIGDRRSDRIARGRVVSGTPTSSILPPPGPMRRRPGPRQPQWLSTRSEEDARAKHLEVTRSYPWSQQPVWNAAGEVLRGQRGRECNELVGYCGRLGIWQRPCHQRERWC